MHSQPLGPRTSSPKLVRPDAPGDTPSRPRPARDALPTVEGHELVEVIARGGMGTVYRARRHDNGQAVAVKILASEYVTSSVARSRFEQEFRTASRLDHPNIVRGIDCGQSETGPYFVMELVDGESLGDRIAREGPLPPAEALRLIVQIAAALEYAHKEGLIHRDVKPDNILLTPDGRARLTDFGLVKHQDEDLDLTVPGRGLGTPNFVAPEQLANAKSADRRCDVYGLGATLYAAVTGRCPFAARTTIQVLKKKSLNELIRPRQLAPTLSSRLEEVILQAMHPDSGQRYGSCAEFLQWLTDSRVPEAAVPSATPPSRPIPVVSPTALSAPTRSTVTDRLTPPVEPMPDEPAGGAAWRWLLGGAIVLGFGLGALAGACQWAWRRAHQRYRSTRAKRKRGQPAAAPGPPSHCSRMARSMGLTKCWSKPASWERRWSSSCPQPVTAIITTSLPQGCSRSRRQVS